MPELLLDGHVLKVAEGTSVAAALALASDGCTRTSVSGQRRAPCAAVRHGHLSGMPGDHRWPASPGLPDPVP